MSNRNLEEIGKTVESLEQKFNDFVKKEEEKEQKGKEDKDEEMDEDKKEFPVQGQPQSDPMNEILARLSALEQKLAEISAPEVGMKAEGEGSGDIGIEMKKPANDKKVVLPSANELEGKEGEKPAEDKVEVVSKMEELKKEMKELKKAFESKKFESERPVMTEVAKGEKNFVKEILENPQQRTMFQSASLIQ